MNDYSRYNIFFGWLTFLIALSTYLLTLEPSVSWWDCGEFIAASCKLEVGHPPGAPLYLMAARIFSLFAKDTSKIALMINMMSAFASAFTVMFLFWTITHFASKVLALKEGYNKEKMILIFGSGLTGALAYTFSDTFWFSAVEAEVYALSSMFTAIVFWAILKWENVADDNHSSKWLILIAYLMGLSIGVHLLNLLAIPAIVLIYYFRKSEIITTKGVLKALILGLIILFVIMYGIIGGLVYLATLTELLFVNGFGFPFNSGVWSLVILITAVLVAGIIISHRRVKVLLNLVFLSIAVILIGYSSYAMIIIRSSANPPLNENMPNNVFNVQYYLNREQYGNRPLLAGHYFDDNIKRDETGKVLFREGSPVYRQNKESGKYELLYRTSKVSYKDRIKLFPRIFSQENEHILAYKAWGLIGENQKAGLLNNIAFFLNYQLGHMYLRYFMWNFSGKQNDIQSHGSLVNGNWISGIKFIDRIRLGNQNTLPDKYKNHPARNRYFLLPLILGISGLLYHSSRNKKDFIVILSLFIMTGIAIVIYLNQTPYQPRERDYAYAGSFYAFSVWIGLGVLSIFQRISYFIKGNIASVLSVFLCILTVPVIMAWQNWDDHDRSGRYTTRDIARNYLDSCAENAIIFTNGDNDTFPLWYLQEVEAYRTDVRVVNLVLLNTDWYIEQLKRKSYKSEPLSFSLPADKYRDGINNIVYVIKNNESYFLKDIIDDIKNEERQFIRKTVSGDICIIPSNIFELPLDIMTKCTDTIYENNISKKNPVLLWEFKRNYLLKSGLMQFDLLANNNWERPLYFINSGDEGALSLEDYFQLEGLAFRLVTEGSKSKDVFFEPGSINTELLYDNLMNNFSWGRMDKKEVYLDHYNIRVLSLIKFRKLFLRLSEALIDQGKTREAEMVLDRCMELAPNNKLPYDHYVSGIRYTDKDNNEISLTGIIEMYFKCGAIDKGNSIMKEFASILKQDLNYYDSLKEKFKYRFESEAFQSLSFYNNLLRLASEYSQEDIIH